MLVLLARVALNEWQGGNSLMNEGVDFPLRLLSGSAPHSHRAPEDLDRQEQDRHRDQGHCGEVQVQLDHRYCHEQERAGGTDEGQ